MKILQLTKMAFYCLPSISINIAGGQGIPASPGDSYLMLYEVNMNPKYVLCGSFESPEDGKTSLIAIADSVSVQALGAVCSVTVSNAHVLETTFRSSPSNEVSQSEVWFHKYAQVFPAHTKVVFRGSVIELSKLRIEPRGNNATYITNVGVDALRELKKMGLEPPEDMDMQKATNHQKQ
jgi:hypothetical protein